MLFKVINRQCCNGTLQLFWILLHAITELCRCSLFILYVHSAVGILIQMSIIGCWECSGCLLRILHNNIHPWDNIALQLRDGAPPSSAGHLAPLSGHLVVVCTSGSAARPLLPWTPRTPPSPRPRWRTTCPVSSTPQAPYTPSSAGVSSRAVNNLHEVSQCLEKAPTLS